MPSQAKLWRNSGFLINDVHLMGYVRDEDEVLDATYGLGVWWKVYRPPKLITNDLRPMSSALYHYDFRRFPKSWREQFDVVTLDPPYRVDTAMDDGPFSIEEPTTPWDRDQLALNGIRGCARLLRMGGMLLVKCRTVQELEFIGFAELGGLNLEQRFVYLRKGQRRTNLLLLTFRKIGE